MKFAQNTTGLRGEFEGRLIREIRRARLVNSHVAVAVSGGADSLALALALARCQTRLRGFSVSWAHVHHGPTEDLAQLAFRDGALARLRKLAQRENVRLVAARWDGPEARESEAEWRRRRYGILSQLSRCLQADAVALGHTQSDLLETRLLRLMRGVGPRGLRSLKLKRAQYFRPMLGISRSEIEAYLRASRVEWLEDPSNQNFKLIRNWVRHAWLKPLRTEWAREEMGLRRSLSRMASDLQHYDELMAHQLAFILSADGLVRKQYDGLDHRIQRCVVAQYARLGMTRESTRRQVDEIHKRLRSPRRNFQFSVGGLTWIISPDTIRFRAPVLAHVGVS